MPPPPPETFPLLEYLDTLIDALRDLAPKAVHAAEPDAVHDARVATRRIKAAVDLMENVTSRKRRRPLTKITRSLRNRLGKLRDLDVMLAHLAKIKSPRRADAVKWIRELLTAARRRQAAKTAADLPMSKVLARLGSWWGLREEILAARDAVPALLAESIHLQLDAVIAPMEHLTDPHPLRIAAKSLRYTLEMARAENLPVAKPDLSHFKRIQDALGLWHDYVVLSERLMLESANHTLAHHDASLQQAVLSLASSLLKRSQHHLARASDLWKQAGPGLPHRIKAAFPLTTDAQLPPPPPAPGAEPIQPSLYQS